METGKKQDLRRKHVTHSGKRRALHARGPENASGGTPDRVLQTVAVLKDIRCVSGFFGDGLRGSHGLSWRPVCDQNRSARAALFDIPGAAPGAGPCKSHSRTA